VYQDRDLIVVDKAAGILTAPFGPQRSRNVKELLDKYLSSQKHQALTVHRIDRYTSGLLLFAKTVWAKEHLVEQFRSHKPRRVYLALVRGRVDVESATLQHQLELSQDGFLQRVVDRGGTPAVCHYRVLETLVDAALLEITLQTGLKNQIRVQLAAIGHPLVGDRQYSAAEKNACIDRQALHAHKLGFEHPRQRRQLEYCTEPPRDFANALAKLRGKDQRPPT
jgi:RluA family pseudouridine synthase